ncbi:hypothetical protein [Streptomyces fulvoviolaceus]|nr:hypothetical protein [Streptomyces fulvoviolaceus]
MSGWPSRSAPYGVLDDPGIATSEFMHEADEAGTLPKAVRPQPPARTAP